jgi:hypothetical protein
VELLATVRWQMLLRLQGICLGWWKACAIVILGLFCNLFLPGLIGGDAVRLYFVFQEAPHRKARATLTVVMDRLLGILSLVCLAGVSIGLRYDWFLRSGVTSHILWVTIALLAGAMVLVALLFVLSGFDLLARLPERFPFRSAIIEFGEALKTCRRHLPTMLGAFFITLGAHGAHYVCYYFAGQSLHESSGATASLADILTIMPLVNTVTAIPISLGGVGIREALFEQLLGAASHVPASVAALTASLGFALQASWGFLGVAAYLWWRRLNQRPARAVAVRV